MWVTYGSVWSVEFGLLVSWPLSIRPVSQPAGQPSCAAKTNVWHYVQTFLWNSFIFAMHIGTIDVYHFTLLSVTLKLAGGHMVVKHTSKISFSRNFSTEWDEIWNGDGAIQVQNPETTMKFEMVMGQFKRKILRLLLIEVKWIKGNCCFTDCIKRLLMFACLGTLMTQFDSNLVWCILLNSTL